MTGLCHTLVWPSVVLVVASTRRVSDLNLLDISHLWEGFHLVQNGDQQAVENVHAVDDATSDHDNLPGTPEIETNHIHSELVCVQDSRVTSDVILFLKKIRELVNVSSQLTWCEVPRIIVQDKELWCPIHSVYFLCW